MSSKTLLLTNIPENIYIKSGFNFAFDLAFSHILLFRAVCYLRWESVS